MIPIFYSYLYKGVQLKHDFIWFLNRNAANIKSKNNKIDITYVVILQTSTLIDILFVNNKNTTLFSPLCSSEKPN